MINKQETIHSFLSLLFQDSPPTLFIETATNWPDWNFQTFPITELETVALHLSSQPGQTAIYIRVCPVSSYRPPGQRGKETDSAGSSYLWVDIDVREKEGTDTDNIIKGIISALRESQLPPTFFVKSGRGVHAYWQLEYFCTDLAAIKTRTKALAEKYKDIGADTAFDVARIMRSPGSYNSKSETFAEFINGSENIYDIEVFPEAKQQEKISDITFTEEPLPKFFMEELEKRNSELAKRIFAEAGIPKRSSVRRGDGTIDRSANDYYIVKELLNLKYAPGVILSVLHHDTWYSGERTRETGQYGYAEYTVRKALEDQSSKPTGGFFVGKKFQANRVADYLQKINPTISVHRSLYMYNGGVYERDESNLLRHKTYSILQEAGHYIPRYENEVISTLQSMDDTSPESLDQTPNLLNVRNGMLNLETLELKEHSPDYLSTIQLPITYDPAITSSLVDDFVAQVLPEDAIDVFWEFVGYCFMTGYPIKVLLFLVGPTNSGKTTILEFLRRILGSKNTSSQSLENLANSQFATSSLIGKMANICTEISAHVDLVAGEKIKRLVSPNELITVERKYQHSFEVQNRAKLAFGANKYPTVSRADLAFLKRFLCIPCGRQFMRANSIILNEEEQEDQQQVKADVYLLSKLTTPENLTAGLNRGIEGWRRLHNNQDFSVSVTITEENKRFEEEVRPHIRFWRENTELISFTDLSTDIPRQKVYSAYTQWANKNGVDILGRNTFIKQTEEHDPPFVKPVNTPGGVIWRGRKIRELMSITIAGKTVVLHQ